MVIDIDPAQFGMDELPKSGWKLATPLPNKRPFCEAKLRINRHNNIMHKTDPKLVGLLADAMAAQKLVMASPDMPLHKIAKREGRCRKQLTQLVKLSWISPRIVDAIIEGRQPPELNRKRLMGMDISLAWNDQERLLGISCCNQARDSLS